jgi:aspartate aminotransferase
MKAAGIDVVGFGAGEPDFDTPDYIVAAAKAALDKGYTKYTPSAGILPLREAIARKFKEDNGLVYEPGQIVVGNGAKQSLYLACQALIEKGDEVVIPAPYWLTYPELVRLCGGKPKFVPCSERNGFKLTAAQLERAINKRTKALILNSPSNPSGAVYTPDEIKALAQVLENAGIYIISDEIYEKLIYGGGRHCSIASLGPKLYERTVTVNGFSKTYSMTGWRLGYLGAPREIAKAVDGIQSHTTGNANSISQYAGLAALTGGSEFIDGLRAAFDGRRRAMAARINKMPYVSCREPEGAFYVMMNIKKLIGKSCAGKTITGAQSAAELFLEHAGAAAVPGEAFGAPDYIRFSYAISPEDIERGLDRIEGFLKGIEK